jgi:hypothetical protein
VPGVRITNYCDQHCLDLPSRLALFIEVCLAIQHAHQKGILHRDIKPSNILVVEHGEKAVPKVIDFGIAKAIEGRLGDSRTVTHAEQFIGTPAYMSPEQAESGGVNVDTRSDIYSLGALLYELLTGRPPFDTDRLLELGVEQMRRELREKEPPRPSKLLLSLHSAELAEIARKRGCEPARLIAGLKGDLDWIVTNAMEKDPQRRYATVNGLALDVQRYLRDQPVSARPPSRLYSLGKLVQRNRVAFAAGTAVAAALIAGLGTSTWLYLRERAALREQTRLRAAAEVAEKISTAIFLTRDSRMEEANALLSAIRPPPDRPSFEGLTAYRASGEWLAIQQRWAEAAERYAVVDRVGRLDSWREVTGHNQAYGVALLMANDLAGYETFRHEHAERFADTANADAVGRMLKMCLLRRPDAALQQRLHPLAERVERWIATLPGSRSGWATITLALWRYRQGDIPGARQAAAQGYDANFRSSALTATKRALLALCALSEGDHATAAPLLATAQADIAAKFTDNFRGGNGNDGYWYDWAFAKLLLDEANALAASRP